MRDEFGRVVERIGVRLIHLFDHRDGENVRVGQRRPGTCADFRRCTGIKLRKPPQRLIGLKFEPPLRRPGVFQRQSRQRTESHRYIGHRLCAEIAQRDHAIDQPAHQRCRVIADYGYRQIGGGGKRDECRRGRICQICNRKLRWLKPKPGPRRRDRYCARQRQIEECGA